MASYESQVSNSCSNNIRHRFSKSQMCLSKILHIISSIPPTARTLKGKPYMSFDIDQPECFGSRGRISIDLNLNLGSVVELGESESFAENGSNSSVIEAETEAIHEKSHQVQSFNDGDTKFTEQNKTHEEEGKEGKGIGGSEENGAPFKGESYNYKCFDILIEAAKVIAKEDGEEEEAGEEEEEEASRGSELSDEWMNRRGVMGLGLLRGVGNSPVVRSKRGRSQALPHRFRDSVVLEPWKRSSGRTRKRPSTSNAVSRNEPFEFRKEKKRKRRK